MKKTAYIIEYNDKEVSGYQTFRTELLQCFCSDSTINTGIIVIDADYKSLTIVIDNKITTVLVPKIKGSHKYDRIAAALRLHIPDSYLNVFFCNFAPASELLKSLDAFYPLSKRILILHDFIAAYYLRGKLNLYNGILSTTSDNITHPSIGDIDLKLLRTLHNEYEQAFRSAHAIICLCEDTVKFISNEFHLPCKKIILINNGLSDYYPIGDKTYATDKSPFRFIFVGRMTDNKGFCTLLEAVNKLQMISSNRNWEVLCAGPINPSRLKDINKNADSQLRVLGSISREELYRIYPTINAALLLSKYEQCSYAGIEFKMFALPVIAISSHGVRNMFNSRNAIVVNPDSNTLSTEIAINMHRLIYCDTNTLKRYAKKSRDDFISRYSAGLMSAHYLDLVYKLTK